MKSTDKSTDAQAENTYKMPLQNITNYNKSDIQSQCSCRFQSKNNRKLHQAGTDLGIIGKDEVTSSNLVISSLFYDEKARNNAVFLPCSHTQDYPLIDT